MRAWLRPFLAVFGGVTLALTPLVHAAEESDARSETEPTLESLLPQEQEGAAPSAGAAAPKRRSAPGSLKGGKSRERFREKETDGTQARDRFEANTVIKSKYESGGQSLEVDPD